ncbi:MAG: hydrogenase, partial [Methanoregula sp.]|nr:hydrogenase [Methanoregula sp.]
LTIGAMVIAAVLFVLKGTILAGIIGLFEASMSKMRFFRLPSFFAMAFFFSTLIVIIEVFA